VIKTNTISETSSELLVIKITLMKKSIGSRIAFYRRLRQLTQSQLAEACGWKSQSRVGNYERDTREPSLDDLTKIAKVLKISPAVLADFSGNPNQDPGVEAQSFDANVESTLGPTRFFEYPEISWVQAGAAMEALELSNISACEIHPSDAWAGPNGFWLKVRGPSMTSSNGISFSEGMVILVAPGFDVESGQYAVAKMIDTNEATFKQFIWDSGRAFLKPLNPAFPTVEVDDEWMIVGRVMDAKWPRSVL
jgi:SOS-response transcriptional repressor LexA